MLKLEDIRKDAHITGIVSGGSVRIVSVDAIGEHAVNVVYRDSHGKLGERMVFRSEEPSLALAEAGRPWALDAPADEFRVGLEAYRIGLAHLFDPMMAVHASNVMPLPHQISAVYEAMLPRQPLRFVLADDPGAGKTIMAGLLIRELIMRADAHRVLIVCPGALTEQWQDELLEKFGLQFELFSREKQEQSASGNFFDEQPYLIARLDQLSRNEDYQDKLANTEWDLIIVDEAHKMSASYFGNKVNETQRFKLGKLLGRISRHFLLMTATPHNGKEADFQLFLSLLDGDRFYGKFREGVHKVDVSDIMRRMTKEELLKFDGTRLFPERNAYTAYYRLSPAEESLYYAVTAYVRNEMNRADKLEGKRRGTVGFALTSLQRRLASSPEAIYQSLKRRRQRLETRLREEQASHRGSHGVAETLVRYETIDVPDDLDEAEDELQPEQYEAWADQVVDQATAAETVAELQAEIGALKALEEQARQVVQSGSDHKWDQLSALLQDTPQMYRADGSRRKLLIFTEHKATLNYLVERIGDLLGDPEAVVTIHGGVNRDMRRKAQEQFRNDPDVLVMVATDAAGEGVNLQNTNLMINYDLPWNPNRLEQRFGRIHRIGQEEVCHLWNLVATGTREGEVFKKLFEKLETEREALGGRVFDILGEAFENVSLKDLLIEAIRYGEREDVKARLRESIDGVLDTEHLRDILERQALVEQAITPEDLFSIREEMEKAEARRLQPYFIRSFFMQAFSRLGGEVREREPGRYEIRRVPAVIRERDRIIGSTRTPVLGKYERICFEKERVRIAGKPMAELIHPAHPLMAAVIDLTLEHTRNLLRQGTVLVDPSDPGTEPAMLFMIDHSIRDGSREGVDISRRVQFVAIKGNGEAHFAGWAPHLDLEPLDSDGEPLVKDVLDADWLRQDLENLAIDHASRSLVPEHYEEVRKRRLSQVDKMHKAVHERLVREILYQQDRALKLEEAVKAGRQPRFAPEQFKRRAEELTARLEQRERELDAMRQVVSVTPKVVGGALVIPQGLLDRRTGRVQHSLDAKARQRIEALAMACVSEAERALGHRVKDVSAEKCGWDITSYRPVEGKPVPEPRHIEVKGRVRGAETVTVTRNEILHALNQGEKYWLAIVLVNEDDRIDGPHYVRNPFSQEPHWAERSTNLEIRELLRRAVPIHETVD